MPHTYTQLTYHIVFGTKDRIPCITGVMRPRLWEYLGGAIRGEGGIALLVNGVVDHVHILARLRPDKSISEILRTIKANSSGWVHDTFPDSPFNWQAGYGAFTVSRSQEGRVFKYIENQEEHHRKMTFEEELKKLLKAHGIEYDERYLWS
jgi:REP-associated tyrosine transposase